MCGQTIKMSVGASFPQWVPLWHSEMPYCSVIKWTCLGKKEKKPLKYNQLLLGYLRPDTI